MQKKNSALLRTQFHDVTFYVVNSTWTKGVLFQVGHTHNQVAKGINPLKWPNCVWDIVQIATIAQTPPVPYEE